MDGPSAPAPGYLTELDSGRTSVIDLGSDVLVELQKISDPAAHDLLLTHVHPDHTIDTPGLLVRRHFHPTAPTSPRDLLAGPGDIHDRIGTMYQVLESEEDVNPRDTFDQVASNPGEPLLVGGGETDGGAVVAPYNMVHPVSAVGYRIGIDGLTIAYTGDTARTDELVELARNADVFICETTWCNNEEGAPPDMHPTGYEAGRAATSARIRKLVLTHILPYTDGEEVLRAAKGTFAGNAELAYLSTELGSWSQRIFGFRTAIALLPRQAVG